VTRTIDFYFFIGSTYTYLTLERIEAAARSADVEVVWRPFFLRSILAELNHSPFVGKPPKLAYMWRDLERRAALHRIRFAGIPPYPVDPDGLANRVAQLAATEGWVEDFARTVYRRWFLAHEVPGSLTSLRNVLAGLGQDPDAVIARAEASSNRAALDAATERARRLGVFGSPTFACEGEIFWGDDRLEEALQWATGTHPGLEA
jgi:2-hydroxychromene-2-carboxylate isomerase